MQGEVLLVLFVSLLRQEILGYIGGERASVK